MRKYRRITPSKNSQPQPYQIVLLFGLIVIGFLILLITAKLALKALGFDLNPEPIFKMVLGLLVMIMVLFVILYRRRERVATLEMPEMDKKTLKLSTKLKKLFSDKCIVDILKLSNATRHGNEMPEIWVYVSENSNDGYIAIENIANYNDLNRSKIEQQISGIFTGKYQQFSIVSSELCEGDSIVKYHFENTQESQRFIIKNDEDIKNYVSDDVHALRLAKDLVWHTDLTAHLSLISRTRGGKSVFAGKYLCQLMECSGWEVIYCSAKHDIYVQKYGGEYEPEKIIEVAERYVNIMNERLNLIVKAGKEKYLDMPDMSDVGLFFDEIGALNSHLEREKALKARWVAAVDRLTATGASSGIHCIMISQHATQAGFLSGLSRVNCSDACVYLYGSADSPDERRYLMPGFADLPSRFYKKGTGVARIVGSGRKWENAPHYYECPWFLDYDD